MVMYPTFRSCEPCEKHMVLARFFEVWATNNGFLTQQSDYRCRQVVSLHQEFKKYSTFEPLTDGPLMSLAGIPNSYEATSRPNQQLGL